MTSGLRMVAPDGGSFPRIFALTGLDGAIPYFTTVNQALAGVPGAVTRTAREEQP